ncbi:MAG: competence/damage-inducible protein A [Thermoplasmata archaeon]
MRRRRSPRPAIALLAIGDELLQGDVLNTNAHWLIHRLTGLGGAVVHEAMVRDREKEIARELSHARSYRPRLVITIGGLGPTDDDRTVAAVARALGRPLVRNPRALAMVSACYARLAREGIVADARMSASREKMALLPRGALPLANRVGAAPGVWIRRGSHGGLLLLPGVPAEMRDIVLGSFAPFLSRLLGAGAFEEVERRVRTNDESVLAPILRSVSAAHPGVYVKSRAEAFARGRRFRVTLSSRAGTPAEALARIRAAEASLVARLRRAGIPVLPASGRPARRRVSDRPSVRARTGPGPTRSRSFRGEPRSRR